MVLGDDTNVFFNTGAGASDFPDEVDDSIAVRICYRTTVFIFYKHPINTECT